MFNFYEHIELWNPPPRKVTRQGERSKRYKHIWFNKKCKYCGKEAQGTDHLHPIIYGGRWKYHNLVPACKSCNTQKDAKSYDLFAFNMAWKNQGCKDNKKHSHLILQFRKLAKILKKKYKNPSSYMHQTGEVFTKNNLYIKIIWDDLGVENIRCTEDTGLSFIRDFQIGFKFKAKVKRKDNWRVSTIKIVD